MRTTARFFPDQPRYFLSAAEEKVFKALKRTLTDPSFTAYKGFLSELFKIAHARIQAEIAVR